ncbi:MAG: hypothetical protein WCF94_01975 [bacterium]
MDQNKKCCVEPKPNLKKGLLSGLIYGLIPHSFCLAFALFSMIGAVTASVILKKALLIPNIFSYLIIISFTLATLSIYFYLKKTDCLCRSGIKENWKYILTVYTSTILISLVFFYGVIPVLANVRTGDITNQQNNNQISLKVAIPCSGHSFLIMDEIRKNVGVTYVKFVYPDIFKVTYDPQKTTPKDIEDQEIFRTFKASIL